MKKNVALLLFILCASFARAQELPYAWNRTIQPVSPTGNATYSIISSATDNTGIIYLLGQFTGTCNFDPNGTATLTSLGQQDIFFAKYNSAGQLLGSPKQIGGSGNDGAGSIVYDGTGSLFFTGAFSGTVDFNPGIGTNNLTSAGSTDTFVARFDTDGQYQNAASIGGTGTEVGTIIRHYGGDIYLTGYFIGTTDLDPQAGVTSFTSIASTADIFMARYTKSLVLTWGKAIGSGVTDSPSSFRIADNAVYIGVSIFNSAFDFDPSAGVTSFTGVNGTTDFGFAKYDLNGDLTWARSIGGAGIQTGTINAIDGSGIYIAGRFEQTVDLDPGTGVSTAINTGGSDAFVCQLNSSGDLVWSRVWSSAGVTNCSVQQVMGSGLVLISGSFEGNLDIDPTAGTTNVNSAGFVDGFFVRLNSAGTFLDGFAIGGPLNDPAPGVLSDDTRIFMSANYSSAVDLDPTTDVNGAPATTPTGQLFATVYTMLAAVPTAQPTGFVAGLVKPDSIGFSFTAAAGAPAGYLVVRKRGSSSTGVPKDGVEYFPGNAVGDGTVVQSSTAISGVSAFLAANTIYHFDVFSFNGSGDDINYRVVSPLEASATTSVATFNRASDSTALLAFYNANGGPGWSSAWNIAQPITTWAGVTVSGGRVTSLDLSSRNIFGQITPQLGNLTALTSLNLSGNYLNGAIATELGSLTALTSLLLNSNGLSESIPTEIYNLTNLTALNLSTNNLTGSLPTQIGNLTALTLLHLGSNKLSGNIPIEIGNLTALTDLRINNNGLSGSLPTQLGNLTNLTLLHLHSNKLSGSLPPVIGDNLSALSILRLDDNQITGSIPPEFGNMTSITELYLGINKLSGSIPTELTNATNLVILELGTNDFTGAVPSQVANLTSLQYLDLHGNRLSDLPDLSALSGLSTLLVNDNLFTFEDLEPNISQFNVTTDYSPQKVFGAAASQTLLVGQSLNLNLSTGGASTNYQWKRGSTVVGTSATYSVPSVTTTDAGSYVLEMTNSVVTGITIVSETQTVSVKSEGLFTWHNGGTLTSEGLDATPNDGINDPAYYGGVWGDINNDGFDDIYLTGIGYNTRNFIYKNNGDGSFSKLPNSAYGFEVSRAAVIADADNDGFPDIYAPDAGGFANPDSINNVSAVYKNNGNLSFSPVALPLESGAYNGAWIDVNNDGKLDLISVSSTSNATLYQNNGSFNFAPLYPFSVGGQWHVTTIDYDNDGDLDVFIPADGNGQRQIFKNNGNGTFTAQTSNLITTDPATTNRHGSWADIDNDGDYDLYSVQGTENVFFLNDGAGNFTKQTATAVLGEAVALGRGSVFLDYDNDGFVDLFTYQGLTSPTVWLLFKNNGNGTFTKQTNQSFKVAGPFVGASAADFNNDGFMDIFSASFGQDSNGLYKNNGNTNKWLQVKLRGKISNRDAVGARVSVKAGGTWRHQQIITTNGFSSQNSLVAQFGLGASTQADSIRIKWPSGVSQFVLAVPANQRVTITEFSAALAADSLALVDLYNATGGASWKTKTNWLTGPINTWAGVTLTSGRVTGVNLANNNLAGTLPVSIGTLTGLTSLHLFGNKITSSVPSSIGNLTALTNLELSNNQLTSVPLQLNNLDALQSLNISSNNLTDLPVLTDMSAIVSFNINTNFLSFEDILPVLGVPGIIYSNQKSIPVGGPINIPLGGSLNLTPTIGGTGNVYQWSKFFINIPGATNSSYTIASTTINDAGSYVLSATNPGVPNLTLSTTAFNVEVLSLNAGDDSGYTFLKKLGAESLAIDQVLPEGRGNIDNLGNYYFVKGSSSGSIIRKVGPTGNLLYDVFSGNEDIGGTDIAIDAANNIYVPGPGYSTMKKYNATGTLVYQTAFYPGGRAFQALVVNLDGSILAMNLSTSPVVQRFDATTGNLIGQITLTGGPVGFYNSVFDIDIDASGNIYVPDGNRVDKFSSAGTFISSIDVSAAGGWGGLVFQVADNGHLYLAPWYSGNTIYHYDNNGALVSSFAFPFDESTLPISLTLVSTSELLVSTAIGLLRFDLTGNFLGFIEGRNVNGQFSNAADVAIDSKGNRYVADRLNHRVQKFTPGGTFVSTFGSKGIANGQFDFPSAIAIDKTDNVYVVDRKNNRVQKFSAAGAFQLSFGTTGNGSGQFSNPVAIAITKTGEILVADKGNSRVQMFNPNGTFILAFGTNGTGQGQFTNLQALAVESDGNILTADGTRLQRFTSKGVFISELNMYGPLTNIPQIKTDIDGNLYVPTAGVVKKFDKNGGLVSLVGTTPSSALADGELRSTSLASNVEGDTLWITDGSSTNRLSVFTANSRKATVSDSLALVDLYNSTKGATWNNKTNWLTGKVETWYGVKMNAGKIRKLNLSSNNLDGSLPPSIVSLNDLTTLNLFNNKISGQVPAWSGPSAMRDLDLSKNLFDGPTTLLPIQVEKVDVSGNLITDVPDLPPFVVGADLSNNRISQLKNFVAVNSLLDTLFVQNNQLTFEDLEPNISIPVFSYAPQDSADVVESVLAQVNTTQTFTAAMGGTANSYQWKKNGTDLPGATNSALSITNISFADDASYSYSATNSIVPGLTLNSRKKVLRVSSIQRDSIALRAFYNTTGGNNWTTKTNWLSTPLTAGNWFGVTVSGNRVTAVSLPNNNLIGSVPAVFADIENLVTVDLSSNKLDRLPNLSTLPNVTSLNVSNNRLDFASLIPNATIAGISYANQADLGVPATELVDQGKDFTLKVSTKGNGNIFQWKRNSTAVTGATDSTYVIAAINRANMGDYIAVVTNPAVPGLTLTSANQKILATATMSGLVKETAETPVANGKLTLFKVTTVGAYDTVRVENIKADGTFSLQKVVLDDYTLLAVSNPTTYPDDLPTYFKNKLYWEEADKIILNEDTTGLDILMQKKPTVKPQGQGVIAGVFEDTNPPGGRTLENRRIANAGASVRRKTNVGKPQEEVLTLVAYIFTNEDGEFSFENLETGDYLLNLQYPGYPMDPNSFISISIGTGLARKVEVDALVKDNKIVVNKRVVTGWEEENARFGVYPNPASQAFTIEVKEPNDGLTFHVTNTLGQHIESDELPRHGSKVVDITTYQPGVYQVQIMQMGIAVQSFRIVIN